VWHRSNWHWYLKQELPFAIAAPPPAVAGTPSTGAAAVPAVSVAWDEERPGLLRAVCGGGGALRVEFHWAGCVSARGTAAVVDGCDVLLTPFRRAGGGAGRPAARAAAGAPGCPVRVGGAAPAQRRRSL
jgi:elongator complex protein 1